MFIAKMGFYDRPIFSVITFCTRSFSIVGIYLLWCILAGLSCFDCCNVEGSRVNNEINQSSASF